jgi:hypothetical protein
LANAPCGFFRQAGLLTEDNGTRNKVYPRSIATNKGSCIDG